MSDQVRSRQRGDSTGGQQMTKAERRAAARAAAARAAEAKRRRQALAGALAGLAVVGVVIAVVVAFGRSDGPDDGDVAGPPAAGATASAAADSAFPPLPQGADPALATKPVVKAGTGELTELTVTPLVEGTGPAAQAGQRITVNYVGVSYRTGEEFDASWKRAEPFPFQLGAGNVIPGWDQGLVGVKVGSRVQLDIPSKLAYGDNPGAGYPAGPLRFVVDLLAAE